MCKEANLKLQDQVAEVGNRLAEAEAHRSRLESQNERYEHEITERETAYRALQSQIALLEPSPETKALLDELQRRENKIMDLEREQRSHAEALGHDNAKLNGVIEARRSVQAELQADVSRLHTPQSTLTPRKANGAQMKRSPAHSELTPPDSPESSEDSRQSVEDIDTLRTSLHDLSRKLAESEAKYQQAESTVANLTIQLSEARTIRSEVEDRLPSSPDGSSSSCGDETSEYGSTVQTPRGTSPAPSPGRGHSDILGSAPLLGLPLSEAIGRDFGMGRGSNEKSAR